MKSRRVNAQQVVHICLFFLFFSQSGFAAWHPDSVQAYPRRVTSFSKKICAKNLLLIGLVLLRVMTVFSLSYSKPDCPDDN